MKAMIFAAGLGTRLKPLTDTMPKALVPVGGKPLIEHVSDKLRRAGFTDLVVNVHHFADMIEEWGGPRFRYSDERLGLLETGGGIKHAAPLLQDAERFLIHNVDILSNVDLQAFWQAGEGHDATLLVSDRQTQRYLIFDDEMRLVGWTNIKTGEVRTPYPAVREAFDPNYTAPIDAQQAMLNPFSMGVPQPRVYTLLAFAGIHQMSTSMLPLMADYPDCFGIIDFYLQNCLHCDIRGYVQPGLRLMDVGKLDTLDQAEEFLKEV